MKSIYFWIVAAIMSFGLLPAAAQEKVHVTINVPVPEGVECNINWQPYTLVEGANVLELEKYVSVNIKGVAPYQLKGVTDSKGSAVSGFYSGSWYFTANDEVDGQEYTLQIVNIDDLRTAKFTLNVDDPSKVQAMMGGYYEVLKLQEGANEIHYDPAVETYVQIQSLTWGVPLYSVKKDGVSVLPQGSSYTVMLDEDCVVDVVAAIPDGDATVTFKYSRGGEGSITGIKVDNVPVEDFDGNSVTVKLGQVLEFTGDSNLYKYEQVTLNGTPLQWWNSYSFAVMEDTEIFVDAHPYGNIKATVVVPNPDLLTVYKGYSYQNLVLELQAGENEVELPENNPTISWTLADNAIFAAKTLNGVDLQSYDTSANLKEGDVLVLDAVEKVYDKQAVVWIDNKDAATCNSYVELYSNFDRAQRYTFEENGYGFISFYEQMNPFNLGWYGYDENTPNVHLNGCAYLNDVKLEPNFPGATSYSITLANNDVLKLFMDGEPDILEVNFEIGSGIDAKVVKDIVRVIENPSEGFDCLPGTQVVITVAKDVIVTVDGEAVEGKENEEGEMEYTLTIDDNTLVTLAKEAKEGLIPSTMKVITTGGTPMVDEPMFSGLGISPNGKYVCGMIEFGQGYFVTDLENDKTEYAETVDENEGAELRHIDNNGLAIGYDGPGITFSLEDGRTELIAPAGAKYILGEAISNRGYNMVGSIVDSGYMTYAAISTNGTWERLPEPNAEQAGMYVENGSAAKFISGNGDVILGHIGNNGPGILWVKNEKGEYEIDAVCAKYVNITEEELDNDTKELYGLTPMGLSNNGKYAIFQAITISEEVGALYIPAIYDIEAKTLKLYKEKQDIDAYGWGLTPTAVANDGSFVGIIGQMMGVKSAGSFYWRAGDEAPITFTDAFTGFAERYAMYDSVGYAQPTGMSANGRYIVGYSFYSSDPEDEEVPAYFETYVIDTDPEGAPEPDDKGDDVSVVDQIASSLNTLPEGIYTLDGHRIQKLQKGINIVRMKDGSVVKVMK